MSDWTPVYRYVTPIDPDYGGAPSKLTLWLDNLGGLVLGIDHGDGASVDALPLPYNVARNLGEALRSDHRCGESITGHVDDDCVRHRGHDSSHRTSDGRGWSR